MAVLPAPPTVSWFAPVPTVPVVTSSAPPPTVQFWAEPTVRLAATSRFCVASDMSMPVALPDRVRALPPMVTWPAGLPPAEPIWMVPRVRPVRSLVVVKLAVLLLSKTTVSGGAPGGAVPPSQLPPVPQAGEATPVQVNVSARDAAAAPRAAKPVNSTDSQRRKGRRGRAARRSIFMGEALGGSSVRPVGDPAA